MENTAQTALGSAGNRRLTWIDNAKGIAILLVILGHVYSDAKFVYGIHLVMFFLLSGYTFKRKEMTQKYISDKFRRLMTPYFITCIAILLTDLFNSYVYSGDHSLGTFSAIIGRDLTRSFFASGSITIFGTLEIGTRIGAIWFLPAMFFAIIIFQFLLQKTQNIGILGTCTGLIALLGYISARFIWFSFSIQSAMMATFFCGLAMWLGKRNFYRDFVGIII